MLHAVHSKGPLSKDGQPELARKPKIHKLKFNFGVYCHPFLIFSHLPPLVLMIAL